MKRQLAVITVVAILALSGCTGFTGGGDEGPTVDTVDYPDGASASGVNASIISRSHNETLTSTSFEIVYEETFENETEVVRRLVDAEHQRVYRDEEGGELNVEAYYVNGTSYRNRKDYSDKHWNKYWSDSSAPSFESLRAAYADADEVNQTLSMVEMEAVNVTEADNTTLITYNVTGVSNDTELIPPVANASGSVVIATDGVVREIDVTSARERYPPANLHWRFKNIGNVTVEPPEWLDEFRR